MCCKMQRIKRNITSNGALEKNLCLYIPILIGTK